MKTILKITVTVLAMLGTTVRAQSDSVKTKPAELPGDNLNLNAVLNVFKESSSVQSFETQLNDPSAKINNLDLNNDGKVDYLRVHEAGTKSHHRLVLQAILGEKDIQDVAVINVTKKGDKLASVQIIGDKALYGKNYIIQPKMESSADTTAAYTNTREKDNNGVTTNYITNNNYGGLPYSYYNAWYWPSVNIMFGPGYTYWSSPYYWGYYPYWWQPWRPVLYPSYAGFWRYRPYYGGFCRGTVIIGAGYRGYALNHRTSSPRFRATVAVGSPVHRNGTALAHRPVNNANWGGYSGRAVYPSRGSYQRTNTPSTPRPQVHSYAPQIRNGNYGGMRNGGFNGGGYHEGGYHGGGGFHSGGYGHR